MPSLRKTLIQLVTGLGSEPLKLSFFFTFWLTQLHCNAELSNNRTKEESARLLGSLIRSSHHLIKPYVGPILDTLLLELLHSSTRSPAVRALTHSLSSWRRSLQHHVFDTCQVGSHVFATIGELARVGRETVVPHLHYLIPLILDTLKQGPIPRREAAMRALGQLACATGTCASPSYTPLSLWLC
jgi:FKBP12-rapamycin complex-associated protein